MFRKSRRKIVATIMSILILLWVGTLSVIYISSYLEMKQRNIQMLRAHTEMYLPSQMAGEDKMPPAKPIPGGKRGFEPGFTDTPMFQLSVFYTVAVSQAGDVLEIVNQAPTVHTDEELQKLAYSIVKGKNTTGSVGNMTFYKAEKDGYCLVAFMDNTVVNENAMTLFRYTLIFGGVALILLYFLSVHLARKIVNPLEESYERQKQFISDAGHELKTPISVVNANADLLAREIGENKWLSNIQYENERMGVLVGQLLKLARTEQVKPTMECIDFVHLTAGELLPFESVAFEKGITLSSHLEEHIQVMGNSTQLKQVVSILLDNAIRHCASPGEVYLSLSRNRGSAVLSVINKGEEIPEEIREKLFERFYRTDSARGDQENHYGLGLAIAKAIVLSHKGRIKVLCYDGLVEFQVRIPIAAK